MNRVDGMEALDAVENGMIKLGQNRDIWQNDVVYAALAGVRLLLLDALKERHEPPIKDTLVRCKDCKHWGNHKPGEVDKLKKRYPDGFASELSINRKAGDI